MGRGTKKRNVEEKKELKPLRRGQRWQARKQRKKERWQHYNRKSEAGLKIPTLQKGGTEESRDERQEFRN